MKDMFGTSLIHSTGLDLDLVGLVFWGYCMNVF